MALRHLQRAVGAAALTVVLAVAGCGSPDSAAQQGDAAALTVVASTDVWASVVQAVAGDAVELTTLIDDPSADPHSYESTPQEAAEVVGADLVVFNGGGYDEFVAQLLDRAGPQVRTVAAYALAGRGEAADEHVWYDLATVAAVAGAVAEQLGALAPERAATFTANAGAFHQQIDGLAGQLTAIRQQHSGARVAVTEPIASYLVEAAGLADVTPPEFVEAVEEETDPPAAAVAQTRRLLRTDQVEALLFNPQTETPVTEQVRSDAQAAGIPVVELTETLPDQTGYVEWMSGQVEALAAALQQ